MTDINRKLVEYGVLKEDKGKYPITSKGLLALYNDTFKDNNDVSIQII